MAGLRPATARIAARLEAAPARRPVPAPASTGPVRALLAAAQPTMLF
jgi:hypothetical protein